MTSEINVGQKAILSKDGAALAKLHLSGSLFGSRARQSFGNISGSETYPEARSSISGFPQKTDSANISGNKA